MPTRSLHRFFIHSALLGLVTLFLGSCTTSPRPPRDGALGALVPQRVDTFVGNPSAKAYARRTVDDFLAQQGQSLNRYVTAETNIFEFSPSAVIEEGFAEPTYLTPGNPDRVALLMLVPLTKSITQVIGPVAFLSAPSNLIFIVAEPPSAIV